jgi:DNA-binding MarR family transcriptional regulator
VSTEKSDSRPRPGRYAYDGLDRTMHEKARLGILTCLASRPEGILFGDLKELCALTDGNLSRHLQTLEEAGLVEVWKGYHKRRPQTLCRLSAQGRKRFMAYLTQLEEVVQDAAAVRGDLETGGAEGNDETARGWAPA